MQHYTSLYNVSELSDLELVELKFISLNKGIGDFSDNTDKGDLSIEIISVSAKHVSDSLLFNS